MPQYGYICPAGHEFDRVASISEMPQAPSCDECGKKGKRHFAGLKVAATIQNGTGSRSKAVKS